MPPPYRNILVRATNWVGDAVMSLPALRAIRDQYPEARISILARPWVADLYAREPFCNELVPYTAARGARDWGAKWRLARDLRARGFDCAILLQNAFEAALLAWMARIPERIGYARDGRGFLLTRAVPPPRPAQIPRHERFYYLELLRGAGIVDALPASDAIRLEGRVEAREAGLRRFREMEFPGRAIGVCPGAAYGTAKQWLPERFAESAAQLGRALEASVALFGSADERALCETVATRLGELGLRAVNIAGRTSLAEFIELAAACDLFLTNDSGAMHIASALAVPTVAIFGSTDHVATGPTGPLAIIVREPVECSPCLLRECPIDHRCMTRVTAGRVALAALDLLK